MSGGHPESTFPYVLKGFDEANLVGVPDHSRILQVGSDIREIELTECSVVRVLIEVSVYYAKLRSSFLANLHDMSGPIKSRCQPGSKIFV